MGLTRGAPAAGGTPKWLKWALIASLAVNLVIIGGALGHRVIGHKWRPHGDRGSAEFGIMGYARTLDAERRAAIRKIVKAEKPNLKALREDIRKARIEAGQALIAEPFDKEKVRAAMARIGEAEVRLKSAGIATLLGAAEQMTPAERTGLLEWWKRRRPHHFRERGEVEKDDAGGGESKPE